MSITTHHTHSETRAHVFLRTLGDQFSATLERRRVIRALKACSQRDLQDIGIIPQDIDELEFSAAADAVDTLSIKSGARAGNW